MNNRDRAADLLNHYLRRAFESAGLDWNSDNEAEVGEIVDALNGMVVDEIRGHGENAPHIYADGSTS